MKKAMLLIVLSIILTVFSSCGGLKNRSSILARDYISNENIVIKINVKKAYAAGNMTNFATDKSIEELAGIIAKKDSSLSVAVHQDRFISVTMVSSLFLIDTVDKLEEDKEHDHRYYFFAPIATFKIDAPMDTYIDMYIPYHLIKGIAVQHSPEYENAYSKITEYESYGTLDNFMDFYSRLEQCDLEKYDDYITVTSRQNGYKMNVSFFQEDNFSKVRFSIL